MGKHGTFNFFKLLQVFIKTMIFHMKRHFQSTQNVLFFKLSSHMIAIILLQKIIPITALHVHVTLHTFWSIEFKCSSTALVTK